MKTKLTATLDQVNDVLGLPVNPRDDNGKLLNCFATGSLKLYRVVSISTSMVIITRVVGIVGNGRRSRLIFGNGRQSNGSCW